MLGESSKGHFRTTFKSKIRTSFIPIDGKDYMAYATSKNSYQENVETGLPYIRMKCDLKNKELFNGRLPIINCEVEESEERKSLKYD